MEMEPAVVEGLLEINAFGQPNVQERKDYTKKYFEALPGRHFARLPTLLIDGNVTVFTDTENASVI
ncbi:MAG: hypothetical protein NPIRA06_08990 [Nitrospirales bacterium]|nr:MAG: hypothetical protein NPIRA06_08990 [Nitrospirales bacterium]